MLGLIGTINWTYVVLVALCILMFVVFAVLFFVAERWGSKSAAPAKPKEKKEEKPKEEKPPEEENKTQVIEEKITVNSNIETNEKQEGGQQEQSVSDERNPKSIEGLSRQDTARAKYSRSRLSSVGRMRDYYERNYCDRSAPAASYGIVSLDPQDDTGTIKLTAEDMRRLKILQEVVEKKGDNPDLW